MSEAETLALMVAGVTLSGKPQDQGVSGGSRRWQELQWAPIVTTAGR